MPTLIDAAGKQGRPDHHRARQGAGWLGPALRQQEPHEASRCPVPGKTFEKGFWAHGPSMLHFKLDGKYTRFTAQVGIDKGAGNQGQRRVHRDQRRTEDAAPPLQRQEATQGVPARRRSTENLLPADKSPAPVQPPKPPKCCWRTGIEQARLHPPLHAQREPRLHRIRQQPLDARRRAVRAGSEDRAPSATSCPS